jgi:hypothetical protein
MTRLVAALLLVGGLSAGIASGASPDPKDLAIQKAVWNYSKESMAEAIRRSSVHP